VRPSRAQQRLHGRLHQSSPSPARSRVVAPGAGTPASGLAIREGDHVALLPRRFVRKLVVQVNLVQMPQMRSNIRRGLTGVR